ncbi:hypothetical protein FQN53_005272 [Emmonsiellopsis sp. PD_33]|nr:hypothetical protein FQN53_005272 [Emmonsiellopsis sp. PD_33]
MAPPTKRFTITFASADLAASTRFATAIGLKDNGSCGDAGTYANFEYTESASIIYTTHEEFGKWLPPGRQVTSTATSNEMIVTFSVDSKEEVDALVEKGIEAGGKRGPLMVPDENAWGLYSRSVEDPDGHLFEIIYHDPKGQC